MKDFTFIKAQNLEEVSRMLLVHHPHACILAGGTDLLVQLHEKAGGGMSWRPLSICILSRRNCLELRMLAMP